MNITHLKTIVLFALTITLQACETSSSSQEWEDLFNGKDLEGWTPKFKGHPAGVNYKNTFRVEEGLLTVSYDQWENFEKATFGHIFTNKSYSNYKIRLEYRFIGEQITRDPKFSWAYRNNGVMLHSPPAEYMGLDQEFPMSAESQLLGGNGTDERTTGNFCSPSTHIIKDGNLVTQHCLNSNSKTFHGDQWVLFEAEVHADGRVKHFINGELVFEYSEMQADPSDQWGKKWLDEGNPLKITKGHIALQAETHPIQFKYIQIKPLG